MSGEPILQVVTSKDFFVVFSLSTHIFLEEPVSMLLLCSVLPYVCVVLVK